MISEHKLASLREVITENLRVQRDGESIDYINVGTALEDACAKQNHAIFARRGCGKTLLLHHSSRALKPGLKSVYLNCEDFKRHSFPNVLIEILSALFRELDRNLHGWFGKNKKAKNIIRDILKKLDILQKSADILDEEIRRKTSSEASTAADLSTGADIDKLQLKFGAKNDKREKEEIEKSFRVHRETLKNLTAGCPNSRKAFGLFLRFQLLLKE